MFFTGHRIGHLQGEVTFNGAGTLPATPLPLRGAIPFVGVSCCLQGPVGTREEQEFPTPPTGSEQAAVGEEGASAMEAEGDATGHEEHAGGGEAEEEVHEGMAAEGEEEDMFGREDADMYEGAVPQYLFFLFLF